MEQCGDLVVRIRERDKRRVQKQGVWDKVIICYVSLDLYNSKEIKKKLYVLIIIKLFKL